MILQRYNLFRKLNIFHQSITQTISKKLASNKKLTILTCPESGTYGNTMRILNVAEKNDAAKGIAGLLSGGHSNRREGYSQYNKIYEFQCNILGQNAQMVMTSVSGHLLEHAFVGIHKIWQACRPVDLFTAPVVKDCPENYRNIKRTLEREVRSCQVLIIWTDCDREGENIGFEIIDTCRAIKPNITVYRAKFSEITGQSIRRSIQQLVQPDKKISDAVDVRSELDLRIGAAFTRFQTLRLQRVFPISVKDTVSYGSCQFPTLGFVVERYKSVRDFIPEMFWKISVNHTINDISVDFSWKRNRLFDELAVVVLHDEVMEDPIAHVTKLETKPKSKWRPLPLDTVELEKQASRKLRLTAKETMRIAEQLYNRGFISYPRTETNKFAPDIDLRRLVEEQVRDQRWGEFAVRILENGPNPRQGNKSDQAHPPIHPTKYADNLQGNEQRVYEFVVRHFLACCDKDAQGMETVVEIRINREEFIATGLLIIERNYLDVYVYERWNSKEIHEYQLGQTFEPTRIEVTDGQTSPPNLLTEADLIALMEKHGIGTDATHAEHIEKIKLREYVGLENQKYFVPGKLGMGLVEGYDAMGFAISMSKPHLRAELEADLKRIIEGQRRPDEVLAEQIAKYREVFLAAVEQVTKLDEALGNYFNDRQNGIGAEPLIDLPVAQSIMKCRSCEGDISIRQKRDNQGYYLGCSRYPDCRSSLWFPNSVTKVEISPTTCPTCGPDVRRVIFTFRPRAFVPLYADVETICVRCDTNFFEALDIRWSAGVRGDVGNNAAAPRGPGGPPGGPPGGRPPGGGGGGRGGPGGPGGRGGRGGPGNRGGRGSRGGAGEPASSGSSRSSGYSTGISSNSSSSSYESQNHGSSHGGYHYGNNAAGTSGGNDPAEDVQCGCSVSAKSLAVRKEGPNQGRPFWTCGQPTKTCNFFLWGDLPEKEPSAPTNYAQKRPTGTDTLSRTKWKKPRGGGHGAAATSGGRKCGNCGQPGHNRLKCPQNA